MFNFGQTKRHKIVKTAYKVLLNEEVLIYIIKMLISTIWTVGMLSCYSLLSVLQPIRTFLGKQTDSCLTVPRPPSYAVPMSNS